MKTILSAALLFYASVAFAADALPPAAVTQQAQSFRPGEHLEFSDTQLFPGAPYQWSRYMYDNKGKWPYGSVYILWRSDTSTPLWGIDWPGDFQPHSLAWVDFNQDGHPDLFFYAGFEDVFSTHIFLWQGESKGFSPANLKEAYKNENDYSMIMDIDHDGHPEILDSGRMGDEHREDPCSDNEVGYIDIPPLIRSAMTEKYHELVGRFGRLNYTYNMPESFPMFNLNIFAPIKIMRIEGTEAKDVTSQYPEQLRWRLGILKKIRAANEGACQQYLDPAIDYLRKRLTAKEAPPQ